MKELNIGFLSSHGGSNMQAVLDAIQARALQAKPCVLISNNSKSKAIERAISFNFPYRHISQITHPDPDIHDSEILETLRDHKVDILLLLGYMKKLGPKTLNEYRGKIINIHPSLLPKYGGIGMYGRNVHEAVLANKEAQTGVTIHLVDEDYDTGRVIDQCIVPVQLNDSVDSLSERVLRREHEFLVETLIRISNGEISLFAH